MIVTDMTQKLCNGIKKPPSDSVTLFSILLFEMTQVLWEPEAGTCEQCGVNHTHVRRCTSGSTHIMICKGCWRDFVNDECNITPGPWKDDITRDWCSDVALRLVFEGEDGTAQRARLN